MSSRKTNFSLNSPNGMLKQFIAPSLNGEWYKSIEYNDAKDLIRDGFSKAAESFVSIGYYLKYIRDKELYKSDGYSSIWEFAKNEYGISQGTASRYISMNTRFSQYGNSPILAEEFKSFGKSQLQELLSIKDEEELKEAIEEKKITPDMTVAAIRDTVNHDNKHDTKQDEDIPGQTSIEHDFPEYLPENSMMIDEAETQIQSDQSEEIIEKHNKKESKEEIIDGEFRELDDENGETLIVLKLCPFCGGQATIKQFANPKNWYYVECIDCHCKTDVHKHNRNKGTDKENIMTNAKVWNRRVN